MLVLTRRVGEAICVGGDIRIVVARVQGNRVRVAIEAPTEVSIRREELREDSSPSRSASPRPRVSASCFSGPLCRSC